MRGRRKKERKKKEKKNLTRHKTVVVGVRECGEVRNHIFRSSSSPDHFLESWKVKVSVFQIVVPETIKQNQQQSLVGLPTLVEGHVKLHFR